MGREEVPMGIVGGGDIPPRQGKLDPLRRQIAAFADRQPGCRALQAAYSIGPIPAAALWTELGDSARFSTSRKAVRHTGLDITVHSSDGKRSAAHLSRQGSPLL